MGSDINKYVRIGDQVMPSTHRGQSVCFGHYAPQWVPGNMGGSGASSSSGKSSDKDSQESNVPSPFKVVVKIREKDVSFKDNADIQSWTSTMTDLMRWQRNFKSGFVAEMIDILEDSSSFYAITQLVHGIDLFEFIHKLKIVDEQAKAVFICKVAYQLTDALRDLSPPGGGLREEGSSQGNNGNGNGSGNGNGGSNGTGNNNGSSKHLLDGMDSNPGSESSTRGQQVPLLVHKDMKLENVVLDDDKSGTRGNLKLIDFDTMEESGRFTRSGAWSQNVSTDVMGTDQYIAPEAYLGVYSSASDIFSVGVMLYKLCVGSFPYAEDLFDDEPGQNYVGHPKMRQIALKLRSAKVDFQTHSFWNSCEGGLKCKDFISRCLIYDPSKRLNVETACAHPLLADYDEKVKSRRWVDFKRVKDVR